MCIFPTYKLRMVFYLQAMAIMDERELGLESGELV